MGTSMEKVRSVQELLGKVIPDRAEEMRKLQDLVRRWRTVVGPAAQSSAPYDLVGGTLYVAARSSHVAQRIEQMRGNIRRALKERWGLDVRDVQVTLGSPPIQPRRADEIPRRRAKVEPKEERVRAFREGCPDSLTPEAADALAHLRAFFVERFGERE